MYLVILAFPRNGVSASTALSYTRQMVRAVQFLHSQFIIHRDLKPGNFLLSQQDRLKLADFGVAMRVISVEAVKGLVRGNPTLRGNSNGNPANPDHGNSVEKSSNPMASPSKPGAPTAASPADSEASTRAGGSSCSGSPLFPDSPAAGSNSTINEVHDDIDNTCWSVNNIAVKGPADSTNGQYSANASSPPNNTGFPSLSLLNFNSNATGSNPSIPFPPQRRRLTKS